jgi:hypothetical protein
LHEIHVARFVLDISIERNVQFCPTIFKKKRERI